LNDFAGQFLIIAEEFYANSPAKLVERETGGAIKGMPSENSPQSRSLAARRTKSRDSSAADDSILKPERTLFLRS